MGTSNLPANIQNMAAGLVASVQEAGETGSVQYMKMVEGAFLFGAEEVETEAGSVWAVHPMGFQHGWVAWGDEEHGTKGKNLGEKMGPAAQALFPESELPAVEGSWSKCIAMSLACTNGEDEGIQCLYKANSYGGRKVYAGVLEAVVEKITAGDPEIVPLVELKADSYKHKTYGKTWTPIFEIVGWRTLDDISPLDGEEGEETEAEPAPEEAAAPPARRRRMSAAAEKPAEEPVTIDQEAEEPEPEPEAPRRRRRRKAA